MKRSIRFNQDDYDLIICALEDRINESLKLEKQEKCSKSVTPWLVRVNLRDFKKDRKQCRLLIKKIEIEKIISEMEIIYEKAV